MKSIEKAIESVREFDFKSATQREIEEILPTFGMNDESLDEMPEIFKPYFGWGIKFWQYPNQLSKLLTFIKGKDISSYLEIGVRHGGTFIILNELLMKYNPALESHCIDVIQASKILSTYQNNHRNHRFLYHEIDSLSPYFFIRLEGHESEVPYKKIDFVFIDGCHAYQCVMRDYYTSLMLGPKYLMFHDIVNVDTKGAKIAWEQIKKNHKKTYEFIDQYDEMNGSFLGIGLVELTKDDSIFPMFKPYFHQTFDF